MKKLLLLAWFVIATQAQTLIQPFAGGGGGGSGTVTSATIVGTANQVSVTSCSSTTTINCTISLPSAITLPGTVNKYTFTAPATGATLTLADGSTLVTVGGYTYTLTFSGATGVTFPTSGTLFSSTTKTDVLQAADFAADAGSNDTYVVTYSPAITAYVTGARYRFKAATANTGAATLNINTIGAKTIVKVAGGITTTLADNDIRANQWVEVVYDGTNMQMMSASGNAAAGSGSVTNTGTLTANCLILGNGVADVTCGSVDSTLVFSGSTLGVQTSAIVTITGSQNPSGTKTFDDLRFTPSAVWTTAARLGYDTTSKFMFWGNGAATFYVAPHKGTTIGSIQQCSATATPCIPSELVPGASDTFLHSVGPGSVLNFSQVGFSMLNGVADPSQLPPTPLVRGTSLTFVGPRMYAACTGTCTIAVPVPVAGYEFCAYNDAGVSTAITLSAPSGGATYYEQTDTSGFGTVGGTFTATAAAGNKVCIVGRDSTHYSTLSYAGTWTAN